MFQTHSYLVARLSDILFFCEASFGMDIYNNRKTAHEHAHMQITFRQLYLEKNARNLHFSMKKLGDSHSRSEKVVKSNSLNAGHATKTALSRSYMYNLTSVNVVVALLIFLVKPLVWRQCNARKKECNTVADSGRCISKHSAPSTRSLWAINQEEVTINYDEKVMLFVRNT